MFVLAGVELLLVDMHEVFKMVNFSTVYQTSGHPSQSPPQPRFSAFTRDQRLQISSAFMLSLNVVRRDPRHQGDAALCGASLEENLFEGLTPKAQVAFLAARFSLAASVMSGSCTPASTYDTPGTACTASR